VVITEMAEVVELVKLDKGVEEEVVNATTIVMIEIAVMLTKMLEQTQLSVLVNHAEIVHLDLPAVQVGNANKQFLVW
jgi:hypothetical protein